MRSPFPRFTYKVKPALMTHRECFVALGSDSPKLCYSSLDQMRNESLRSNPRLISDIGRIPKIGPPRLHRMGLRSLRKAILFKEFDLLERGHGLFDVRLKIAAHGIQDVDNKRIAYRIENLVSLLTARDNAF